MGVSEVIGDEPVGVLTPVRGTGSRDGIVGEGDADGDVVGLCEGGCQRGDGGYC